LGIVWLAIISTKDSQPKPDPTKGSHENYLDKGRRYKLISSSIDTSSGEEVKTNELSRQIYQKKVLDCQPLEKPVLKVFFEEEEKNRQGFEDTRAQQEKRLALWRKNGLPKLAFPYLKLKKFSPIVPEIHEAWQEGEKEVILLSDRSNWKNLSRSWQENHPSSLEIIYCLDKVVSIWEYLVESQCGQSVIEEKNLCLDEDEVFGLQQLYLDEEQNQPTLQDLGEFWQRLLGKLEQPIAKPLEELLEKMVEGKLRDAQELSTSIEEIAEQEQNELEQEETISIPLDYLSPVRLNNEGTRPKSYEIETDTEKDDEPATEVLPMQLQSVVEASCTDVGRSRQHNEDSYGLKTHVRRQQSNRGKKIQARGLYVVCDGMGGHASGEVASAMAVETIQNYMKESWRNKFPNKDNINSAILAANQAIYNINQNNASSGSGRMGTTLVMVILQDTRIAVAHIGDSRVYRLNRKWGLEQLTVDHEVGQRQIQQGIEPEVAYSRPDAYQLTQAIGPHENDFLVPDIRFIDLQEDTLLLLCSDGLSDNNFIEKHWEEYLAPLLSNSSDLETGLNRFIELANEENGHDNITGILVRIKVRPYLEQNFVF